MKTLITYHRCIVLFCLLFFASFTTYGQINYANSQANGATGLLCLGCNVSNPTNSVDGNLQTFSTLNVTVGLAAKTYQEMIFPAVGKVPAGTPVTVKLGTADNLVDLTALGGISVQAYYGSTAIGTATTASTLVSVLSNNNQYELTITPGLIYDRVRVTLNGGLLGALSSIYVYEAFYNGTGPAACNSAVDELHGISSTILGLGVNVGGVVNPQFAIDGNLATASTLNAGVVAIGAYAQQTIIYQSPSVIGDSIRITFSFPKTLLDAGVLSSVGVSTFNGSTDNGDTQYLNSSLLNVRLLDLTGGVQKLTATIAPTKVFDRVQIRLGNSIANVLSTLNIYEAQKLIPRPIISFNNAVTSNAAICTGSTATLTVTPVANTTFKWYAAATGGTAFTTSASYTTPALTATTTYYVSAMRSGCTDESERTPITVTANSIPTAPVITNSAVTVCPGQQAIFAAQAVTGVTVNWYAAATGGTLLASGNTFTSPALTANATYYAEATNGTCTSPTRTAVTATISALPATPAITVNNASICSGSVAVLSVTAPVTGVTYNWYSTATGGTPLYTGINYTTPALTANATYYAEAVNSTGCASSTRAQATVTVNAIPADPVLSANSLSINSGQTVTINVSNAQTGVTYNWYLSSTDATPVFTGNPYTTPALYASATYYVNAVNAAGCVSVNRTAIAINVNAVNNAGCSIANQQTTNINGLCILCSVTNSALAADVDTTTSSTITVSAGVAGAYAEQQLVFPQPGFAGDTIKIGLSTPVSLADVGLLGQIQVTLYNGATQVSQYNLSNSLIKLSLLGGGSNKYDVYIPATGNYDRVTIRLTSGLATLLTSLQVYYAVQQYPKPVVAPASTQTCNGSPANLIITSPTNGTFNWYTTPTGGAPVLTGTNVTTPALTANTTYYIEYTRGTCVSTIRYPVTIIVNDVPAAPVVNPTSATIYSGQTTSFTATAPNNVTVKWYSAASGGTALYTGNTFTTPALTAGTDYYAEASIGNCTSPGRTHVTVTVNPVVIPDVTVTPATQSVGAGASATLTASSTTPGTTFNWYATPTGGTSIFTGPVFNTPAINANTTYYAEAVVTASGAVSATRAAGAITINTGAVSPTPCDAAIDQASSNSGVLCIGCTVTNATAAVDADRNTFSQLNVLAGVLNAYEQQTLRFATIGHAGDSVVVELGIPGSLANVGVLSQISLATYNGTTYNNDRFNVNGSLLSISLLSGTSLFRVVFKAGSDFDRVEIRLNSSVAGLLNSLNVYDASQEVAAPVVTAATVATCQGSQATLTATAPSYATVKWYSTATGGSPLFTGITFNTPALTANTTYYAEASRTADGCTQVTRTPVNVTVTPIPAAPVVNTPTATVCSGQPATFTAQAVSGITFNWYTNASGGTPVFTGNPFVTPNLTATTNYYVEADGTGQCGSTSRTLVTANVTASPLTPTVSNNTTQTCSGSSAVLTATSTQPGVTFNWYTAATGGTPVFTGAQYTTPTLTANTAYFVEAASGSCTSPSRAEADVTVNPAPVAPTVTVSPVSAQVTSGQTATLTASSTTAGATFNWYTSATGGTPISTSNPFVTPALTSNTTYYAESALATGCISPTRTAVTITVNPIVSTSCDVANSQSATANGLCIGCTVINPLNATDADTTTFSQLNVPIGLVGGYQAQTLIFGDTGIAGDSVSVRLAIPVSLLSAGVLSQIQIASYNGGVYNNDRVDLTSGLLKVRLLAGQQNAIIKFAPGAAYDRIEVRLNGALASLFSTLNIYYASKQVENPRLTASTVNICSGSTATFTVSNARTGVTYKWYDAPTGGSVVGNGASFTTGTLTATTTFYVESSRTTNGCVNPNRVAATVNVTPSPVTPVLTQASYTVCAGTSVTFAVNNAGTATINWYDAPVNGNLLFTGINYTVAPVTSASYYAEATNGTCTSPTRAVASVTINALPLMPTAVAANVQICQGSTATLQVASPQTGVTYNYYTVPSGGAIAGTGTSFITGVLNANATYYVEAANTTTGCINNGGRARIDVTITAPPVVPVLSAAATTVCNGGSASISVVSPVTGIQYNWYTALSGGLPVFTGTTYTLNNLTANASYFVEASNSLGCISSTRTETDITVLPIPTAPVVQVSGGGSGVSTCSGSSATLSISSPQSNQVYRWFDAATNGNLLYTGTQFVTPPLTTNTTYYVETSTQGNCNASSRTAVPVTVNSIPATPVLAANSISVCNGSAATLSVSSPVTGVTYNWYDSPTMTTLLFTGTTYVTGPVTSSTNFYVGATNASGCSNSNLAMAQVTIQTPPDAPTIANGSTVQACSGSTVTLTIANPQSGLTYNWYAGASGGSVVSTGTSFTTAALTNNVTYYAEAVNGSGCSSASRTAVAININPVPVTPVLTQANATICAGASTTFTVNNAGTSTINWYDAATNGTLLFTGASYTVTPTANASYYAEATNGSCVSSTRAVATVTINAIPATPVLTASTVAVCNGSAATLSVSTPVAGVNYKWYDSASMTNLLFTGSTYVTGAITSPTNFYVGATNASNCSSSSLAMAQVTVNPAPGAPIIANGGTVQTCSGSTVTLTIANPQSGFTYNWYAGASGGSVVSTGTSFTTAALTNNVTYYAEAVNGSGCSSASRTAVAININPVPVTPVLTQANATICAGTRTTFAVNNAGTSTVNWYDAATNGNLLFTGASYTVTPTANASYYAEATNGSCVSATRAVATVTINAIPATPVLTAGTVAVCSGSAATLSVSSPVTGLTYKWYDSATMTNLLFTGSTYVTAALTAPANFYVGATNASNCSSSSLAMAQVTVNPAPGAPTIANGGTVQTCSGSTVTLTIANPQSGFTYNWYAGASGGSVVSTGTSFTTAALTNNVTYYAEAVNGSGCSSASRTAVAITINAAPVTPVLTQASYTVCTNTSVTFAVNNAGTATIKWYDAATNGNLLFTGVSYTVTPTATASYYAEASNGTCISPARAVATVTVNAIPATPVLTASTVAVCNGSAATLSVSSPVNGVTYKWYDSASMTNLLFTGSTYVTGPITSATNFYVAAANGSGCSNSNLAMAQVTVQAAPGAPVVANGNAVQGCTGTQITLTIANAQSGFSYNWYTVATGGSPVYSGTSFVTPALSANSTYYAEAVNASGCTSLSRTPVTININAIPGSPTISAAGISVCPGLTTTLTATASAGATISWFASASGGTALATGGSFTTPVLNANATYYAEAVNAAGCSSPTRTAVTVNVLQALAAPLVSVGLTTGTSVVFNWASVPGATGYQVSVDNGITFNAPSTGITGLSHEVDNLQPGKIVTIIVRATGVSACQLGSNSLAVTATTNNPMGNNIFVPNAFTPNGDGNNDVVYVYSTMIKSINFYVYDQWGEMLFKSTSQSVGWDGTYKGTREPVGTYVYYLDAIMNDGTKANKKGTITLLR
jgi:gliding motility-associated-like protein